MILVVGGSGQVGRWLAELGGDRVRALGSADLDVTDAVQVASMISDLRPTVVINSAAHTAVDAAEDEPERAAAINRDGAGNLARASADAQARFVHISTDYVFGEDSVLEDPLTEGHSCAPLSVYGRTKLEGERAVREAAPDATIVRTAWVYTGPARKRLGLPGSDFVTTMIALEASRETVAVVDDQVGSPTYARDLADGLLQLVDSDAARGRTVHAAGAGRASWCDLARAVFEEVGADSARVHPCTTADFPRPAPRPAFSVLSSAGWEAAGLSPLRDWREAVTAAIGR
jgi:dTDP-4-dehydrorhamnose reductase